MSNNTYRAAVITVSDKGSRGEREDTSGKLMKEILESHNYEVVSYIILPDEQLLLENELKKLCDENLADLILTTGGTGLSPRDRTPEATIAITQRLVPGISEAMRLQSINITKRAMLSRGVSGIRGKTLIINLPGSTKAVRENLMFIINELEHALDTLMGNTGECG